MFLFTPSPGKRHATLGGTVADFTPEGPTDSEVADALSGIEEILWLDELEEIDLPPYLMRLLLQLEESLTDNPARGIRLTQTVPIS